MSTSGFGCKPYRKIDLACLLSFDAKSQSELCGTKCPRVDLVVNRTARLILRVCFLSMRDRKVNFAARIAPRVDSVVSRTARLILRVCFLSMRDRKVNFAVRNVPRVNQIANNRNSPPLREGRAVLRVEKCFLRTSQPLCRSCDSRRGEEEYPQNEVDLNEPRLAAAQGFQFL
ncbi:MAG: hypothetical protein CNIPEHKO_02247 [Anaerolineales bacterium]|nr:hypothetical protein [Anaerolineales bacterium]